MTCDLEHLPRAFGKPVARGVMKQSPEDFVVVEDLGFELDGKGEHVCLRIAKRNQNTAWVAGQIAKFASVRPFDVSYAGRKDRRAMTEQWFSVWLPVADPDWDALEIEGVSVLEVSRHGKKLRRGCHRANRFRLVLRDVSPVDADLDVRLESIRKHGFPNYFGEQRFGHDGGNLERADALLTKNARPDRKKDLYLSAARSFLFNTELAARIADGSWQDPDAYGWLPGAHRKQPDSLFMAEGFASWYAGLDAFGLKAMRRPLRVVPEDFEWSLAEGALTLAFTLPRGAFATSLLRECIDVQSPEPVEAEADGE